MNENRKAPPHAWKKGQSGNPSGKKPGSRNKATMMVLGLMEKGAEEITTAVIVAAKGGDLTAAKLVLERIAAPVRERHISIELPETLTAEGCAEAQNVILHAVGAGELLPSEATALAGIVENRRRALETSELAQRLTLLEEQLTNGSGQ
jgi:hypothetical protein